MVRVGRRLAELREGAGLTQAELAEQLDLGIDYVQRVEVGRYNVTILAVDRICSVLGADIGDAFRRPRSTKIPGPGRPKGKAKEGTASNRSQVPATRQRRRKRART